MPPAKPPACYGAVEGGASGFASRSAELVPPGRVGAGARNGHRGGLGAESRALRIAASDRPAIAALVSAPCSCSEARMPALNVSPAPTVSTTVTGSRRHRHLVVAGIADGALAAAG